MQGKILFYNDAKGFGFIGLDRGGDLFFHITACAPSSWLPTEGEPVTFSEGRGRDGRPCALDVRLASKAAA